MAVKKDSGEPKDEGGEEPKKPVRKRTTAKSKAGVKKGTARKRAVKKEPEEKPEVLPVTAAGEAKDPAVVKLNMFDRVRLAMRIAAARGKPKPDTWPVISKREGLSERQCQRVLGDYKRSQAVVSDQTGMTVLDETLELLTETIGLFAQGALDGETWAVKIGAGRSLIDALKDRVELMAVMGKMPRSIQGASDRQRVQRMLRRMAEVLERRGADPEMIADLIRVIDDDDGDEVIESIERLALTA